MPPAPETRCGRASLALARRDRGFTGGAGFRMAGNLVQGALFTVMVVRAGMLRDAAFDRELEQQIGRSPRFFLNAPVVLDLKDTDGFTTEDEFLDIGEVLRRHTLALVGVQNALPEQMTAAAAAGLAGFAPNATQPSRRTAEPVVLAQPAPTASRATARLITEPVRSGTQIYARGPDLVVTAAVRPAAELAAHGKIHVSGAC